MRLLSRCFSGALLLLVSSAMADTRPVVVTTKNNTPAEQQTKSELEQLMKKYDLSRYTFTHNVIIDKDSIPHSHPVLTIHTRHLGNDDQLLSTYVHEQLHWFLVAHQHDTDEAEADLRKLYPKVPVGPPDGARDEESTYLHLIDCYLEGEADRQLMGADRADALMEYWSHDHYRWIYRLVIEDHDKIGNIVTAHHLTP